MSYLEGKRIKITHESVTDPAIGLVLAVGLSVEGSFDILMLLDVGELAGTAFHATVILGMQLEILDEVPNV